MAFRSNDNPIVIRERDYNTSSPSNMCAHESERQAVGTKTYCGLNIMHNKSPMQRIDCTSASTLGAEK